MKFSFVSSELAGVGWGSSSIRLLVLTCYTILLYSRSSFSSLGYRDVDFGRGVSLPVDKPRVIRSYNEDNSEPDDDSALYL